MLIAVKCNKKVNKFVYVYCRVAISSSVRVVLVPALWASSLEIEADCLTFDLCLMILCNLIELDMLSNISSYFKETSLLRVKNSI